MDVCGVEYVKWFWTGPWLVTCRRPPDHAGRHSEVPSSSYETELREAIALGFDWHGRDPHRLLRDLGGGGDRHEGT